MSEPGNFLARWSRRKREANRAEPAAKAAPGLPPDSDRPSSFAALQPGPPELSAPPAVPADLPSLTEEELAALPKLDELTAETDMTQFLRPGVPEAMRNAALRRGWMLDPSVRDYVCEAREYAYDWNLPGDVPGSGPLPPGLDVKAVVGRLFGNRRPPPQPDQSFGAGPPAAGDTASAGTASSHECPSDVTDSPSSSAPTTAAEAAPAAACDRGAGPETAAAAAEDPAAPSEPLRRRHGGALPA